LELGVIGVMGTAAMPSVVLIAYISRAYAVLRNENHHLSCHTTLCRVTLVNQPSMEFFDFGILCFGTSETLFISNHSNISINLPYSMPCFLPYEVAEF
jgi:hypothetical protein